MTTQLYGKYFIPTTIPVVQKNIYNICRSISGISVFRQCIVLKLSCCKTGLSDNCWYTPGWTKRDWSIIV